MCRLHRIGSFLVFICSLCAHLIPAMQVGSVANQLHPGSCSLAGGIAARIEYRLCSHTVVGCTVKIRCCLSSCTVASHSVDFIR